jgi:hypothetical protein
MNMQARQITSFQGLLALLLLWLVAACGAGGGGISGSGGVPTGTSSGPIDGFGSVIVNGVRFNTSSATFTKDGEAAIQDDFRVGMVIELEGNFSTEVASSVSYRSEVKGPATSVSVTDPDLGTATLVVLGQTVRVNAQTIFDGTSLGALAPGDLLEVSGPRDTTDAVVATFVQLKASLAEYKVVGTVTNANPAGDTFRVGGLDVDYSTALLDDDFAGAEPADGDLVEVKGLPGDFTAPSDLLASKVEPVAGLAAGEGARLELEGYITDFVSAADFRVLGFPVRTTGSTTFINGTSGSLANNVKVQVKGSVAGDGYLEATSCEIQATNAVRTEWEVESVDTVGSTVTVLGVTWEVRPETELRDDSSAGVDPLTLGDLSLGDLVQVRGYMDGSTPVAVRLDRDDPQSDARLRGPVTSVANIGSFEIDILGTTVRGDGTTIYRNFDDSPMSQQAFFDAIGTGTFVDAKWDPFNNTGAPADELSLEND